MKLLELNPLNDFRDPETKEIYDKISAQVEDKIDNLLKKADEKRKTNDRYDITEAACIYLVLAQRGCENADFRPTIGFHYAAHQLRRLEQLNRAAQAYENSGRYVWNLFIKKLVNKANKDLKLGLRAAGRAKGIYSELGELENVDNAYVLQQNLKSKLYKQENRFKFHLNLWKFLTLYGTSPKRWFISFTLLIVIFTLLYEVCYLFNLLNINIKESFTHVLTPFYFTIVTITTLGYGDVTPTSLIAQIIVVLNLIFGYILLGVGITFFTRK